MENNRRVSNILESITDSFIALDYERRFTYMNSHASRALQKGSEEVIGKGLEEVFPEIVDEDFYPGLLECIKERTSRRVEFFSRLLQVPVEMNVYASVDGVSIYFRDISRRKNMEEQLRSSEERFRGEVLAKRKSVLDLLEEHPACELPFAGFLEMLPLMTPLFTPYHESH